MCSLTYLPQGVDLRAYNFRLCSHQKSIMAKGAQSHKVTLVEVDTPADHIKNSTLLIHVFATCQQHQPFAKVSVANVKTKRR